MSSNTMKSKAGPIINHLMASAVILGTVPLKSDEETAAAVVVAKAMHALDTYVAQLEHDLRAFHPDYFGEEQDHG